MGHALNRKAARNEPMMKLAPLPPRCLAILGWLPAIFSSAMAQGPDASEITASGFVSAAADFPRLEKNLRKWETPVVADLDQDGWEDLILNEHGLAIQIMWNNKGKYAKPWDLIMGDINPFTPFRFIDITNTNRRSRTDCDRTTVCMSVFGGDFHMFGDLHGRDGFHTNDHVSTKGPSGTTL